MRIRLDEELARAARDDRDPGRLDAATLLAGHRSAHRRRLFAWLAALAVVTAAVAGVAWYRPRLGPAPTPPAPSPSPTPQTGYQWDGSDPNTTPLSEQEVARRCPARAGERVEESLSRRTAGGEIVLVPKAWKTPAGGAVSLPKGSRTCRLGFQHVPQEIVLTTAQVTSSGLDVVDLCSRASGFDFHDHDWHVVTTRLRPVPTRLTDGMQPNASLLVALVADRGWLASCDLPAGVPTNEVSFQRLDPAGALGCETLVPDNFAWQLDPHDSQYTLATVLMSHMVQPVWDAGTMKLDSRAARVDVRIDAPGSPTLRIPVVHGVLAANDEVAIDPPVRVRAEGVAAPVTATVVDAHGKVLRTCHR